MALTERLEIANTNVLVTGEICVRRDTVIERDGVEISRLPHRHVVSPNDDITNENQIVKDIAAVVHTQAVKDAWAISHPVIP